MAETAVSIARPPVAKAAASRRSAKPATVSASALALHLDCSRTYIGKLEAEGVIQRQGDGFPLDQSRVAYLRYLRREKRPSPRGNRRQTKLARNAACLRSIGSDLDQRTSDYTTHYLHRSNTLWNISSMIYPARGCKPPRPKDLQASGSPQLRG